MTDIKAQLNYLRISPRKVRLVADLVRGKNINTAIKQLSFMIKKPAVPLKKLLNSAVANAKNNFKIQDESNLFIKEIRVDEGRVLKRYRARAFGRAAVIRKRTSKISLILSEQASAPAQGKVASSTPRKADKKIKAKKDK